MRLNNTLAFAVQFNRFSQEFHIPGPELAQMISLARASVKAYERDDTKKEQELAGLVEQIAANFGCKVSWPGLWPTIGRLDATAEVTQMLPSYD